MLPLSWASSGNKICLFIACLLARLFVCLCVCNPFLLPLSLTLSTTTKQHFLPLISVVARSPFPSFLLLSGGGSPLQYCVAIVPLLLLLLHCI